jgi:glutathione reductase (NADPH)
MELKMPAKLDLLVLGAGNAGIGAASVARAAGLKVAIVEGRDVGGTCPLRGCVPKKVLVAAAQALNQIALAPVHHIETGPVRLDWAGLMARERSFVAGASADFEALLGERGILLKRGHGRFAAPGRIAVGEELIEADRIVIATGSKPRPLTIAGAEQLITSEDILEMAVLPRSLVFIGGGVVALEFSHVLARAGCRVTILEATDRLLPSLDGEAVAVLQAETARVGIEVHLGVTVERVLREDGELVVEALVAGAPRRFHAERVANGAGRVPDLDALDLEAGGVAHEGRKIAVDAHLRSRSNPRVYVAGDALWSAPQLSPVASYTGRLAGENIVKGDHRTADFDGIPANVYAVPGLASVGGTEAALAAAGRDFVVKRTDMSDWRSARTYGERVAFAKVMVEKGSGRILGAHLVGHGAEEVIHLFAFAMKQGIGADALASSVYAYPTFSSDLKYLV